MDAAAAPRARIIPRVPVRSRDAITLVTDVYLPQCTEPRPTVVVRTPYGRNGLFLLQLARRLNQAGFCVVLQDCRGRYQSEGTFDLKSEEDDSFDTLTWIGEQEWSDNQVGLLGISISTYCNLLAAIDPPEGVEVKSLVDIMGVWDCYSVFFRKGALIHHWALPWVTLLGKQNSGKASWKDLDWEEIFFHQPLATSPELSQGNLKIWQYCVSRPIYNEMWRSMDALEKTDKINMPILHIGGWSDFLLNHALLGFEKLSLREDRQQVPRQLVVGSWDHLTVFASFGSGKSAADAPPTDGQLDLMEMVAAWYEKCMLGDDSNAPAAWAFAREPDVLVRLPDEELWIATDHYPLREAETVEWFLASDGNANTWDGDGRLVREQPAAVAADRFTYDPEDPVPTIGGAIWPFAPPRLMPGKADQSEVEQRPDVLVYTSEVLEEDLVVIGPVFLELWAASSARDTDFTGKLVDVDPHGVPRVIQDGIVRGRYHESIERETFLDVQRPYCFTIDMHSVAHRFLAGHCIRLEVSSSNFPKFDRNLNIMGPLYTATQSMVAQQTVFHGGTMASRLRLPVVRAETIDRLRWQPPEVWQRRPGHSVR